MIQGIQLSLRRSLLKANVYHLPKMSFSSDDNINNWRGVPLSEMYGSQTPWGAPEFPLVCPGHNHAVLYHIPSNGNLTADRPPKPQIGQDKWDSDHVRMPCSSQSLYPIVDSNHETHLKKRWQLIEVALQKPIRNTQELASTILSYNTKFKGLWKFRALHQLFNDYLDEEESQYFFEVTLPEIAKLALALPKLIQAPIPLLKQHKNQSVSISQQQISSLLANAFFGTFPRRNTSKRSSEYANYPHINFVRLYEMEPSDDVMEKLKSICHYFRRVCTKVPVGVTTFSRRSVAPRRCPDWPTSSVQLASLPLHVDSENTIEEAAGLIQVDFANKYLGGGVLGHGSVQEEIRFVICPELMISMLFTETLRHTEALLMIGCERYSKYSGYGHSYQWTGDFADETPFDSSQRRRVAVLAIDALPYSTVKHEYRKEAINRELNKAWVGFSFGTDPALSSLQYPGIATGNWGCGAFGGTPQLKSLIQMMACAQTGRPMAYYTFSNNEIRDDVIGIYNLLARYNVTVGQLYKYIMRFSTTDLRHGELHPFLHQTLRDEEKNSQPQEPVDMMETSTLSETPKLEISSIALKDSSPDLFSQGEFDESLKEVKLHIPDSPEPARKQTKPNNSRLFDEMQKIDEQSGTLDHSDNKSPFVLTSNVSSANSERNNSRLLDEMQKIDEQSGRLNLSVHTSPFASPHLASSEVSDCISMDTSNTQSDATTEIKKKISRKITDYFGKKSL